MKDFDLRKYLQNNPLLKEDFPEEYAKAFATATGNEESTLSNPIEGGFDIVDLSHDIIQMLTPEDTIAGLVPHLVDNPDELPEDWSDDKIGFFLDNSTEIMDHAEAFVDKMYNEEDWLDENKQPLKELHDPRIDDPRYGSSPGKFAELRDRLGDSILLDHIALMDVNDLEDLIDKLGEV